MEVDMVLRTPPDFNGSHYLTGTKIKGDVLLRAKKELAVLSAHVWFSAGTSFMDKQRLHGSTGAQAIPVRVICEEEIFREHYPLLRDGKPLSVIPGEIAKLPFQLQVPAKAPSSVPDRLSYQVFAIVETKKKVLERSMAIPVLHNLDITEHVQHLREQLTHTYCQGRMAYIGPDLASLCEPNKPLDRLVHLRHGSNGSVSAGLISVRLQLPKRWFILGERVPASVQISNHSSEKMYEVCLVIVMLSNFHGYNSALGINCRLEQHRTVATLPLGKVRAGETMVADNCSRLRVPAVPTSGLRYFRTGDIDYSLQLCCHRPVHQELRPVSICDSDRSRLQDDWEGAQVLIDADIIIGTRPFIERDADQQPQAMAAASEPNIQSENEIPVPFLTPGSMESPPSYEATMRMDNEEQTQSTSDEKTSEDF